MIVDMCMCVRRASISTILYRLQSALMCIRIIFFASVHNCDL